LFEKESRSGRLVRAATIILQPLAVAISHKVLTCVVLESGHGNTQICPISRYPIRNAILPLNRGGGDGNTITAELLKDCGYGDLIQEEALVRRVKENIGLIPRDLGEAIKAAKLTPDKFRATYKIEGTRITIDLSENSWMRFLIGEYVFDPNNEIFQSYFTRGMPKPRDIKIGDVNFMGMLNYGDAIAQSVEECPVELQPYLYNQILLSGGNFSWRVPVGLGETSVDSATKVKILLEKAGISNSNVSMADAPQFSVWRGALLYGYAVPDDYPWNWERMEGWVKFNVQ
jgi:crenactin